MKISERAKIFGSFSPLKSFGKALLEKEKIVVPKVEVAEDKAQEIDRVLHLIQIGDMVCVVHYSGGEYIKTVGCVSRLVPEEKALYLAKTKINFDDIYNLYFEG